MALDDALERRGSNSYKWDGSEGLFGRADLLPFWVADMDFATPEPIRRAIEDRVRHPVFGYQLRSEEYFDAVRGWLASRHGWEVPQEWLTFCPPSSIVAMYGLVVTLTGPAELTYLGNMPIKSTTRNEADKTVTVSVRSRSVTAVSASTWTISRNGWMRTARW